MSRAPTLLVLLAAFATTSQVAAQPRLPAERGTFHCGPCALENRVPERFRLEPRVVNFERRVVPDIAERYDVSRLTFASPLKTALPKNNLVHCEFFAPRAADKRPAVIVLHVMGGDFELARMFCHGLAYDGVAALFLVMPYYGPRRDAATVRQMISPNPAETIEGMTQAVLDIRRAASWLASRPEVNAQRLGVCGISVGGITAALAMAAEPRFARGCFLLAGGDVGRIAWESEEFRKVRPQLAAQGWDQLKLTAALKPIDPAAYPDQLRGRRVLMLNGKSDNIVPRACTESLCAAIGRPEIVWYEGGHYTAMLSILDALARTQRFFRAP